jgi:hypothetical protein
MRFTYRAPSTSRTVKLPLRSSRHIGVPRLGPSLNANTDGIKDGLLPFIQPAASSDSTNVV